METLTTNNILLQVPSEDKFAAIRRVGNLLVERGYVEPDYIEGMIARENSLTTYIGNGVAIPHGMPESVKYIKKSGIVIAQYPDGVVFDEGKVARLVIGIAGRGEEHIEVLGKIAIVCQDEDNIEAMVRARDPQEILDVIRREGL
jgi:PTS system mannitol-specific IIA component